MSGIHPRKVAGWEFFNENVHLCDVVRPGGLHALAEGDRTVAEMFIAVLSGCHRVIDLGCGSGFPGLYVAPYVDELVSIDAAPAMVKAAQANASLLQITNVVFKVGGADGVPPIGDGECDGALLCGVLESTDWEGVLQLLSEVHRVLMRGGRLAVLDQEWRDVLQNNPQKTASIHYEKERLLVQVRERRTSPNTEKCTWYLVDPCSSLFQRLQTELGNHQSAHTAIDCSDLEGDNILDAWYDETAQFDAETLTTLTVSHGFRGATVETMPVWDQKILFLRAIK